MVRGRPERSARVCPARDGKSMPVAKGRARDRSSGRLRLAQTSGTVQAGLAGSEVGKTHVRLDCRPSRRPRHGEIVRRRAPRPQRASLGRDRAFSGRRSARGGGVGHGCDLRRRAAWRQRHDPPRRGADLRGFVDRLPLRRRVPVDPQHGRLGHRRLRLAGAEKPLSASPRQHGIDRELLPDRARRRAPTPPR